MINPSEGEAAHLFSTHMDAFIPKPADFGRYVNGSNYWNLTGLLQESLLTYWLQTGNLDKIRETRQDFRIDTPLTEEEILATDATQEIIRRPGPIFGLDIDPQLSLIIDLAYTPDSSPKTIKGDIKTETQEILTREKERLLHFYPGRFSPAENIGSITAARRYLAILSKDLPTKSQPQAGLVFARTLPKAA